MADSMEIPGGSLQLLAIAPPRLVILSAMTVLASPMRVIQWILGGATAAMLSLLLATFPQLYDAVPQIREYIMETRGLPSQDGNLAPWIVDNIEVTGEGKYKNIKAALSLMYHLVRKPQQNPVEQIQRRFNAMFATVRPGVTPHIIDLYTSLDFTEAASSFSSRG